MATLFFFIEVLAVALVATMFLGYGTVRNLLAEICGLVLDLVKTVRSFSKTSSTLAAKLETEMAKKEVNKK